MSTDQPPTQDPGNSLAFQHSLGNMDPVKVGDFWLDARLSATTAGTVFVAHEAEGDPVMLLLLAEGAATDHAARARFAGEVDAMHIDTVVARGGQGQSEGRLGVRYRDEDDDPVLTTHAPLAPWVALAFDGTVAAVAEAERVLHAVDLELTAQLGAAKGPNFLLHWSGSRNHGTTRLWPLPWPGRRDRAGWITLLVSWLLMVLLTAVGILLAILVFQNQPLVSPPPPIPQEGSGGASEGEPSSANSSGEPSSASGSPVDPSGDKGNPSDDPSMREPSGEESGPGSPTPNRKL